MLAAFLPRVGHTQTYNIILRTNCKRWPYETTLYTTVTLQQPRGSVAYERRIRWFFLVSTCFLIMLCLFMLLEIMCTVIIIFRATWKIKHTLEYKVTDQCLRIIKQILQTIKHLIFTSNYFYLDYILREL